MILSLFERDAHFTRLRVSVPVKLVNGHIAVEIDHCADKDDVGNRYRPLLIGRTLRPRLSSKLKPESRTVLSPWLMQRPPQHG